MNTVANEILKKANEAAIYSLYLSLAHKTTPADGESLGSIVARLEAALSISVSWKERDIIKLNILKNAVLRDPFIAGSKIGDLTRSIRGLTACTFTNKNGEVFVCFRGTGKGEWIDNGEGLSGIPEENTYKVYSKSGRVLYRKTVKEDYATDQQVEALNWFNKTASKNRWRRNDIILSGHSKGGNKAQFVALRTPLAALCFSFDGQGFSPEAVDMFRKDLGKDFDIRRRKIFSLSADNDYINVLGERIAPNEQVCYFESKNGLHYLEAILDDYGVLRPMCEQGSLSKYFEGVSKELMGMAPVVRQYATNGIMNILQKLRGSEPTVNSDAVSTEETIKGIAVAITALLRGK